MADEFDIVLDLEDLNDYLTEIFPQVFARNGELEIVDVSPGRCSIVLRAGEKHLRPGGSVSGPALFTLADCGGYACCLSHLGREALAVTTNLNINFMRKSGPGEIIGHTRILKKGRRLLVFDIDIEGANGVGLIAHASGTYAIPPR